MPLQLLLQYLHPAFGGVGDDGLQLVLVLVHGGAFGQIAAQMDGIEVAFGRAHAAADALVGVDDARAALQAPGGLGADLLFGES